MQLRYFIIHIKRQFDIDFILKNAHAILINYVGIITSNTFICPGVASFTTMIALFTLSIRP